MKMMKIVILSLAISFGPTVAMAQHGHSAGAMGSGMGNGSMGVGAASNHTSAASTHGSSAAGNSSSSHQATISNILDKNPAIGDKITTLTGATSAADACTGFKNLGQCVAAAHVAKNLSGGNFYCLRQAMTGTLAPSGTTCTTTGSMSLGKAIHTLYPQANSKDESKKGNVEANDDLKASGVRS